MGSVTDISTRVPHPREELAAWSDGRIHALIVESEANLGWLWKRHLDRMGVATCLAHGQEAAAAFLHRVPFDVIVLDLVLERGSALAIADLASYLQPEAKVIFVTNTSFFSDGSIFRYATNACALMNSAAPPSDLAALVEHYGSAPRMQAARKAEGAGA
ncbi:hypothetical protein [Pseudooceanicola sp. 200-1SW]|uniref:hypothetical protein n=1 Tax=Pseudooceanicola sp. 200-1SW TaxID=3425949 RepID=UPI003D7F9098